MNKKTILLIDYGMGNIGSVSNALDYLGCRYTVSNKKEDIRHADAFILPGVGAFPAAMENLGKLDLVEDLTEQVMTNKKPFLGICLGMQLVARDSVEQHFSSGLGWIDGHVLAVKPSDNLSVPHVGWNNVHITDKDTIFSGLSDDAHFYFDHCFHLQCDSSLVAATSEYGGTFTAAIHKENIFATQFHPEKSQRNGLKLLRNFLNFVDAY